VTGYRFIGQGIDAVEVERFRAMLARRPRMAERIFTPAELERQMRKKDPVKSLAARFAVREATMKAMGVGLGAFKFHDVSVVSKRSGEPTLKVEGAALELAQKLGITDWHVSITHTDSMAFAIVTAF